MTPWIVCARGHEVRVLPMKDTVALQIRVNGATTTTTLLGPQARLAVAEALTVTSSDRSGTFQVSRPDV